MLMIGVGFLVSDCHRQKPVVAEAIVQEMHRLEPGMTAACLDKFRYGGVPAMPEKADECYSFSTPRRFSGVWLNHFEGSQFCPPPAEKTCPPGGFKTNANDVWLEYSHTPPVEMGSGGEYQIEFIGRRSEGAGTFGHMGGFPNDIIVDKLIAIEQLRSPPPDHS